ncbi:conserved hypothetical protein [Cupriavidus taiwanensis]|uniref:Uncharacterized protein n=1 Tax=Cupriavidus taiwanensis TaxID=164546 RepID=A0A375JE28_9BURK|nr:conserved hypothetical protein [Cupriavidus taiwanensis]
MCIQPSTPSSPPPRWTARSTRVMSLATRSCAPPARRARMRKSDLMKALSTGHFASINKEPPERAVFLHSEEIQQCCSILGRLFMSSIRDNDPHGRHTDSIPLPAVDLPMIF